jgi:hypothetical protein
MSLELTTEQRSKMMEVAEMSPQQLSLCLNKKCPIGYKVAVRLEEAAKAINLKISFKDWMSGNY